MPLTSSKNSIASCTNLRPRSVDVYRSLLKNHLLPEFGPRQLAKVSAHDVRTWVATMQAKVPRSAANAYRLLRAIFNTALEDGLISRNPCRVRGAGTDRADERPAPSVAEVQKLVAAMPERFRLTVLLAAGAGLRRNEVLGLQRGDIDFGAGAVHVRRSLVEPSDGSVGYGPTKNGETRTVHVSDELVAALSSHLDAYVESEATAPLFVGKTGRVLRPGSFERVWRKAREATGLTLYHFHDLRHFMANQFSFAGANLKETMARGGWKSVSIVARYQHANRERDAQLAQCMPILTVNWPARGTGGHYPYIKRR